MCALATVVKMKNAITKMFLVFILWSFILRKLIIIKKKSIVHPTTLGTATTTTTTNSKYEPSAV